MTLQSNNNGYPGRHICDFLLHNALIRGRIMQYKKIQEVKFVAEH